ncbi:MAG: carboxypeptidase regulatory-like domain-containing protein [Pyrinomonadaceae bacterium]|nr:carboxypeptidase regulatory-like domain-containing protein [Pyrinomonadaceae bacterium]
MSHHKFLALVGLLLTAFVNLSLLPGSVTTAAAGGEIAGVITDPKGAVVVGASVTVTNTTTNQIASAVTDGQGRYKVQSLPAGLYRVRVAAPGFAEQTRAEVKIEDGKTASLDLRLEVAAIDAGGVTVTAAPGTAAVKGGKGDEVYQQLRAQAAGQGDFAGPYASVNNLVLRRDAATFTLRSGEIYFLPPVAGRTTAGVFIGDGELQMTPPVDHEKRSLALFTGEPSITESFTKLTLRFTDKTFDEIKNSPQAKMATSGGAQAARARDIYRDNQTLLRRNLRANYELRTLVDLYAAQRPGFFVAFIGGKRFNKLVFQLDPLGIPEVSPEEVLLSSYGETDGGFWTAFHLSEEYHRGQASSSEDHRLFDITHHEIDAVVRGTKITATDVVTLRPLTAGLRVLPFSLYRTLRVSRVVDAQGRELPFVQEGKDSDADFGVIWPEPLDPARSHKLTIEYAGGDAISDEGSGNFFLIPRSTWYPNNDGTQFADRALFNLTFHYPKSNQLIATGALAGAETREGDVMTAKWTSGDIELAVAGFNYGRFKKKELLDTEAGYNIEFYANQELPDYLRNVPSIGALSTTGMADAAIADTQNASRIYNAYFGKLPYSRIAMSQQPAPNFGQAWPTLIYMPLIAYLDTTQRLGLLGVRGATDDFWKYVGPHEVAHQWWGHMVGWNSYRDQWMSEGFAEFSTSLFVQFTNKDTDKFIEFWKDQRDLIITSRPQTQGRKPYTVGPLTQGYRLNSGKTGQIARFMIYPKGAYIPHMLRMMMWDARKQGDARFRVMMRDFIKTHYNKDVSTEDLKRIVEKHMTPEMDIDGNRRMDWFFDEWVYGTEVPSYKFEYQINGNAFSGRITQSGVSDQFRMRVPLYLDFGKGWTRLGSATLVGNSSLDIPSVQLPQAPKRAALAALHDVLAVSIENTKR